MLKLYGYWRSSAAYRVRIALNLKGLAYQQLPVHLLRDGGEQHAAEYRALNPQGLLPLLVDEQNGGVRIAQSLAILEYLEEIFPVPSLLPADPAERAQVRALALHIACDVHPLNNLRVLQYLGNQRAPMTRRRTPGTGTGSRWAWPRWRKGWRRSTGACRSARIRVIWKPV